MTSPGRAGLLKLLWFAAWCLAAQPATIAAQPLEAARSPAAECTNARLSLGLLADRDPGPCVLPSDVLPEAARATLADPVGATQSEVVTALRVVADQLAQEGAWASGLRAGLRSALETYRAGAAVDASFAEIARPVARHGGCRCAWVVSAAGGAGAVCYRFNGGAPAASDHACNPGEPIVTLPDWPAAARAFAYLRAIHAGLTALNAPARKAARGRIELARDRWNGLRKHGYFQYPWELWVQGFAEDEAFTACFQDDLTCSGEEGLDPDRTRWVFLHPEVGLGLDDFGSKPEPRLQASFVLSLELLGVLRYASDMDWFYGASLGVGVANGVFKDPRLGVFVHVTRFVHLGYLLSLFQDATRYDATLFIGLDLTGWIGRGIAYAREL